MGLLIFAVCALAGLGFLWWSRWIIAGLFIFSGLVSLANYIIDSSKAKINNMVGRELYLAPPANQLESNLPLVITVKETKVITEGYQSRPEYNFIIKGSIKNYGKWSYNTVRASCGYADFNSDLAYGTTTGSENIDLKPGQTVDFGIKLYGGNNFKGNDPKVNWNCEVFYVEPTTLNYE